MYRSIIVPLDGSPLAERALPIAAGLAESSGALLHVVVVHKWLSSWTPTNPFTMDLDAIEARARGEKVRYAEGIAEALTRSRQIRARPVVLDGFAADQIGRYARTSRADLVVMTTHGRGGFNRYWFGSVADRLIHRLSTPILLCRAAPGQFRVPELPFTHVLVALDGSVRSETALRAAEDLSAVAGPSRLELLMVLEPPHVFAASAGLDAPDLHIGTPEELRRHSEEYLHTLAEQVKARGGDVTITVIEGSQVAEGVLGVAETGKADLIALATRGRGGAGRFVMGSVADKVLRAGTVPILVTHPPHRMARISPAFAAAGAELAPRG
ncbi:MAG: universal stress protein [Bacillota bacterium]|jgi:nucleotide-binding universal stress UspA family protein